MTRYLTAALSTALLLLLATGCSQTAAQAPNTQDADIKAVTEDVLRWKNDFASRDLEKMLSHYTDETMVVIPGMPVARDAESRRAALKTMLADPALNMTALNCPLVRVAKSGDYGYAQCNYTFIVTDPATKKPVNDKGGVVEVYKKLPDGSWRVVEDIAYSELPPAPANHT